MTPAEKIAVKALEDIRKHTELLTPTGWHYSATWKMATNALEAMRRVMEIEAELKVTEETQ